MTCILLVNVDASPAKWQHYITFCITDQLERKHKQEYYTVDEATDYQTI